MTTLILRYRSENQLATQGEIKQFRDFLAKGPVVITVGGTDYSFDSDRESRDRMQFALDQWGNLSHMMVAGELLWVLSNDTLVSLSQAELQQVLNDIKAELPKRTDYLMKYAIDLWNSGTALRGDLNETTWMAGYV